MERITSQSGDLRHLGLKTLLILSSVRRPLTADELCDALAVETGQDAGVFDEDNVPDMEFVLSSCAGLVLHQPDNDIVQLVHKSTQEYLSSELGRCVTNAEAKMMTICMCYTEACKGSKDGSKRPFLAYLDKHSSYHALMADRKVGMPTDISNADVIQGTVRRQLVSTTFISLAKLRLCHTPCIFRTKKTPESR